MAKDTYEGWTHDDFQREYAETVGAINKSIDNINKEYTRGLRSEMDGPFSHINIVDD